MSQLIELRQVVGSSLITRRLISVNNQLDSIDNERSSQRSVVARAFDLSNSIRRKTRKVYTTKVSFYCCLLLHLFRFRLRFLSLLLVVVAGVV